MVRAPTTVLSTCTTVSLSGADFLRNRGVPVLAIGTEGELGSWIEGIGVHPSADQDSGRDFPGRLSIITIFLLSHPRNNR